LHTPSLHPALLFAETSVFLLERKFNQEYLSDTGLTKAVWHVVCGFASGLEEAVLLLLVIAAYADFDWAL